MALTIGQAAAFAHPAIVLDMKGPANQWAENSAMETLEEMGFFERKSLGNNIQAILDYRRNPGAKFKATSLEPVSLAKTEVVTAAEFAIGEISVPVVWA